MNSKSIEDITRHKGLDIITNKEISKLNFIGIDLGKGDDYTVEVRRGKSNIEYYER